MDDGHEDQMLLLGIFGEEILSQAAYAAYAFDQLDFHYAALSAHGLSDAKQREHIERFWFYVDAGMAASTKIANVLWPTRSSSRSRARMLRAHWGLPDEPRVPMRQTRNQLEHWDEYVDRWTRESNRIILVDRTISDSHGLSRFREPEIGRLWNTSTGTLSVFGEGTDMAALASDLTDIQSKVREGLATTFATADPLS